MSNDNNLASPEKQKRKKAAKEAFREGYKLGYDVENYSKKTMDIVDKKFKRWWQREME